MPRLEPDPSVVSPQLLRRVQQTVACGDCDDLPKVERAGQVVEDDGQRVQIMHNGVLVEAGGYFGDWMSEIIRCLRGHHEPQEELVFARVLERLVETTSATPTALELGAFWAYYSLWFLNELPHGKVIAVEPDPAHLEVGRRNMALNGRKATFVQAVMGCVAGAVEQFQCEDGSVVPVRATDLAELLFEHDLPIIDLLLCDIQGGEGFLFEQAAELLRARRVRFAVISTHHHSISGDALTHQRLLELLPTLGAHVIAEHSVSESCSGDGLIAVSFDPRDQDLRVHTSVVRATESLFGPLEQDLSLAVERVEQAELLVAQERVKTAALQAEVCALRRELLPLQDQVARAQVAHDDLARLRGSRIFAWSEGPRALYAATRRLVGR